MEYNWGRIIISVLNIAILIGATILLTKIFKDWYNNIKLNKEINRKLDQVLKRLNENN